MKLILCRHGQTEWNKIHKFQGLTDIPLNETGLEQAEKVSELLLNEKFSEIYSSKLIRAIKTAEIINENHSVPMHKLSELNELNFGVFEGKSMEEVIAEFGESIYERVYHKYDFMHLKGQSYVEKDINEILPLLKKLISRHLNESIAVVAHEGVNRLIISNLIGLNPRKQNIMQSNDCVYFLEGNELGKFEIEMQCINKKRIKGFREY
ncbi:MAG: histidine phosphatase family protein [Candidatus Diapherotrites archaeon]